MGWGSWSVISGYSNLGRECLGRNHQQFCTHPYILCSHFMLDRLKHNYSKNQYDMIAGIILRRLYKKVFLLHSLHRVAFID